MTKDSVGTILKNERESKNLTLHDIARWTLIRETYLEAIEEGQYDHLPGTAVAQGFVKNYAQFLGLDVSMIMQKLNEELTLSEDPEDTSVHSRVKGRFHTMMGHQFEVVNTVVKKNQRNGFTKTEWTIIGVIGFLIILFFAWIFYF